MLSLIFCIKFNCCSRVQIILQLYSIHSYYPFSVQLEHTVSVCQNFDSKIRRDHRKNCLLASVYELVDDRSLYLSITSSYRLPTHRRATPLIGFFFDDPYAYFRKKMLVKHFI